MSRQSKKDDRGHCLPLSLPRRLIIDLMRASRHVPLVPMERCMRLAPVVAARRAAVSKVSWCAVFLSAYARVTAARPAFRRAYLGWPWPRLYEHPRSVASVAVERVYGGEEGVLFGLLDGPETMPLTEVEARLERLKTCELETQASYRRCLRISKLPQSLRRLAWWFGLEWLGQARAKVFGTFGVSATAGQGAGQLSLVTPCTTTLHYGRIDETGSIPMRLTFDHRALDGAPVARALAEMEDVLLGPVLAELRGLAATEAA